MGIKHTIRYFMRYLYGLWGAIDPTLLIIGACSLVVIGVMYVTASSDGHLDPIERYFFLLIGLVLFIFIRDRRT